MEPQSPPCSADRNILRKVAFSVLGLIVCCVAGVMAGVPLWEAVLISPIAVGGGWWGYTQAEKKRHRLQESDVK